MIPTELKAVQQRIIKYATEVGWKYVPRINSDERRGDELSYKSQPYYSGIINEKVREFNPWISDDYKLPILVSRIEGNKEYLEFIRNKTTAYDLKEKRERNVIVIDYINPKNNVYELTDEYSFSNTRITNRQDIVFLINGIPLISIECKNITTEDGIDKGLTQIRRYHEEIPELFAIEQMFVATDGIRLEYGVTWNTTRRNIFTWKGDRVGELENKIKTFFDINKVLDTLEKYIMFIEKDETLSKIILQEHQIGAVEAVLKRALTEKTKRGLIWHTQGSGKTYTMIKTAELLFKSNQADKPTVVMMLDRNELQDQMDKNLSAVGLNNVKKAESIKDLVEILQSDYRGIVITMIHKFRGLPADLNKRDNIYVLIDEAHRTTGGDLGTFVMASMPNATYIGYTGTPVDKTQFGRGTFKTFGINDAKGYLHKYSIQESIEDGTTLPLYYSLASNEMLVPKETLEREFFSLAKEHGITDIDELNTILERAVNTKNFLKGKGRVEKVCKFVAEHFKTHIEPMNYKAFLVAVDREACALYKKELDKQLPPEWSEVVYTSNHNDSALLKEFTHLEEKEREIRREYIKISTNPKILIVTEKLLTGFDAPILYCMYLDKPMRDHTLLQTIARVNRPYENEHLKMVKPHGFVLDFIGIFDNLENALAFDSDEIDAVVKDIDILKERFKVKITIDAKPYLEMLSGPFNDKLAGLIIETFRDDNKRKEFFKLFIEIEMLYEIISPDIFLRQFIEDYMSLSSMYHILKNAFSKQIRIDHEFQKKTEELVREHIESSPIKLSANLYKIDSEGIEIIKSTNQPYEVKIINLVKTIQKLAQERAEDPVLLSIKEMAESIKEKYDNRQLTTQQTLEKLIELFEKEAKRDEEQKRNGISNIAWFIRDVLTKESVVDIQAVKEIEEIIQKYPEFSESDKLTRDLRNDLYDRLELLGLTLTDQKRITNTLIDTLAKTKGRR